MPNGTVDIDASGEITVTPDVGFAGDIDLPYTIVDQDGDTDSAVHTVTVGNAPPVVIDPVPGSGPFLDPSDPENIIVPAVDGEEIVIDLDDYLIDPNGDSLTITPDSLPAGVNFDATTNELTFTPTVDNVGDAVASFIVDDGNGGTTPATVTIQPVNPVPVAENDVDNTDFETAVVIDLLSNDSDPDGDDIDVTCLLYTSDAADE